MGQYKNYPSKNVARCLLIYLALIMYIAMCSRLHEILICSYAYRKWGKICWAKINFCVFHGFQEYRESFP